LAVERKEPKEEAGGACSEPKHHSLLAGKRTANELASGVRQ